MLTPTSEMINEIINYYINGESVLSLSRKYNCLTRDIQKILDANNIPKVSQAKRNNSNFIEDYFKTINSKEKAYWIGWLLTDGGITTGGDIEMSLNKNDLKILELFEKDLGLTNHIKPFNKNYYRLQFGSVNMCKDLKQYGIIPNKTMTLTFPNNIPEKYESHLLRGMFEGDGGLTLGIATRFYKHRNKTYTKPYREMSFTGTYDMCQGFQKVIMKYINITEKNINNNHSIYRVRWSNKNEIINILDFIYKDCEEHYLNRKYDLYIKLKTGDIKIA